MEFNIVTLDMIFALGIKEFSGFAYIDEMIEQFKIIGNKLHYWDSGDDEWDLFTPDDGPKEHLEEHYYSFFTWELIDNEIWTSRYRNY